MVLLIYPGVPRVLPFILYISFLTLLPTGGLKPGVNSQNDSTTTTATIIFTGDISFDGPVKYFAEVANSCDYSMPFSKVREQLLDADLRVGNLESPLVSENTEPPFPDKGVHQRGSLRGIEGLKYAGFDVVQLANNHMSDYGDEGIRSTVKALRDAKIDFVGLRGEYEADATVEIKLLYHKNSRRPHLVKTNKKRYRTPYRNNTWDKNRQKPLIKVVNGLKIGFLAYCQNEEGCGNYECKEGEECTPNGNIFKAGPAVFDRERASQDVVSLKKVVDVVVVLMHWSREYSLLPPMGIREIAKALYFYGANLIIGSHPHVIQGHECVRKGLAVYSLGNFLFAKKGALVFPSLGEHKASKADVHKYLNDMKSLFNPTQLGYIFKVKFSKNGIIKAEYLPIDIRNEPKTNCLQPTPLATSWQTVCTETDLYCLDFRNIYATAPAMLEEQLFAVPEKSRTCVKD